MRWSGPQIFCSTGYIDIFQNEAAKAIGMAAIAGHTLTIPEFTCQLLPILQRRSIEEIEQFINTQTSSDMDCVTDVRDDGWWLNARAASDLPRSVSLLDSLSAFDGNEGTVFGQCQCKEHACRSLAPSTGRNGKCCRGHQRSNGKVWRRDFRSGASFGCFSECSNKYSFPQQQSFNSATIRPNGRWFCSRSECFSVGNNINRHNPRQQPNSARRSIPQLTPKSGSAPQSAGQDIGDEGSF